MRIDEWRLSRKDVLDDAAVEEKNNRQAQLAALAYRRKIGDSAILAAGITLHRLTPAEIRQQHKIMFENTRFGHDGPVGPLPTPLHEPEKLLEESFAASRGNAADEPASPIKHKKGKPAVKKPAEAEHEVQDGHDPYDAY